MCKYCYEGHAEHDCNNGIVFDDNINVYVQVIETCEEVPWGSGYDVIKLEVKHCPMCGRDLYQHIK